MPAGCGDFGKDFEPFPVFARDHRADRLAGGVGKPGLLFERRVGFLKHEIVEPAVLVVDRRDDAKSGVDRFEQRTIFLIAAAQFLKMRSRIVLPSPPAYRRFHQAYQRRRMERPFEKGDVAKHHYEPQRRRIALDPAAFVGQQDKGKIGPFGLLVEPFRQRIEVFGTQAFLGYDPQTCACAQFVHQRIQ